MEIIEHNQEAENAKKANDVVQNEQKKCIATAAEADARREIAVVKPEVMSLSIQATKIVI